MTNPKIFRCKGCVVVGRASRGRGANRGKCNKPLNVARSPQATGFDKCRATYPSMHRGAIGRKEGARTRIVEWRKRTPSLCVSWPACLRFSACQLGRSPQNFAICFPSGFDLKPRRTANRRSSAAQLPVPPAVPLFWITLHSTCA